MSNSYPALIAHVKQTALLASTQSLLGWDQETMMPSDGAAVEYRSRQASQLARLVHEMRTDRRIGDWLAECEADRALTGDEFSDAAVNIREIRREYGLSVKLPASLVEEFSKTTMLAKHHWAAAKQADDYASFRPWLDAVVKLCRAKAECWGHADGGERWDALADAHEPGMTAGKIELLFTPLKSQLTALMHEILGASRRPTDALAGLKLPMDKQRAFNRMVAKKLGFDFTRGRIDESHHPFCLPLHRDDVRMTSRYREGMALDGLGSTMHESGHGIYNQNIPGGDALDTPAGSALRYAIHESQARLVENQLGRSRAFWAWCGPRIRDHFSPLLDGIRDEQFYESDNTVEPGLVRTESDELTYNLHIMARFDLERALIQGDLSTGDLPAAWREKYKSLLGVEVPNNAQGCMQDIHWAMGAFGYFPTYTLGNLYAAQLYEAAQKQLPGLDERVAKGEFQPLMEWLKQHVHLHGRRYAPDRLVELATGQKPSPEPLLRHLRTKFAALYGLA